MKKMQLNLFTPFLNEELLPNNQYVTYIDTTNSKKDNATPDSHNIKKSLKSKKFGVRFELKYNHQRFFMNEAGFISIDMKTFHKSELPAVA